LLADALLSENVNRKKKEKKIKKEKENKDG
jgi:hypothetical protein